MNSKNAHVMRQIHDESAMIFRDIHQRPW